MTQRALEEKDTLYGNAWLSCSCVASGSQRPRAMKTEVNDSTR